MPSSVPGRAWWLSCSTPVTSTASENSRAWRRPFWPVVESTVSSVSCGASGICRAITLRTPFARYDEVLVSLHGIHQGVNVNIKWLDTTAIDPSMVTTLQKGLDFLVAAERPSSLEPGIQLERPTRFR